MGEDAVVSAFTGILGIPMSSQRVYGKTVSDVQTDEQEETKDGVCPECENPVMQEDRELVCTSCGLVVEEQFVDLAPQFQLKNVEKDEDKRGLETGSPYMLDEAGSPFESPPLGVTFPVRRSDWKFDGKDSRVSDRVYEKWDDIRYRQIRRESNSRDNWRTDALQDIKTIGRNAGVPGYVCKRATELFRDADDEGLPGGRMAFESVAVGTVVVAAREAGFQQSIDDIAQWARTPHERACAGARKVRVGLDLAEHIPPGRQDAVKQVLDQVGVDAFEDKLKPLTSHLMELADTEGIGPGTPRMTVAASAVYAADRLIGEKWLTQRRVVEAASELVEMSTSKIGTYSRDLVEAYVDQHGTDDPSVVLDNDRFRLG